MTKATVLRWLGPPIITILVLLAYDFYARPLLDDLRFLRAARIQALQQQMQAQQPQPPVETVK